MSNSESSETLDYLSSMVGKQFTDSPSPFGRWLRGRIEHVESGAFSLAFEVREEFTNPMGYLHGGVIAAIADDVIGTTILGSGLATNFATINLLVQYVAPAKLGDEIVASTKLVDERKRMLTFDWRIEKPDSATVARGTSQVSRVR